MEHDRSYWEASAAEWQGRAEHFARIAAYYADRGAQYSTVIEEAQEEAAWANERAANARKQLEQLGA